MRWGINLRGDLAKLDDVEIASRYEALVSEKVALIEQRPKYPESGPMHRVAMRLPWRGPLHARIFYRLQYVLLAYVFEGMIGSYAYYMMECELRDVTDEIKRRVAQKNISKSYS